MLGNEYALAKNIASWKRSVARAWGNIEVVRMNLFDPNLEILDTGTPYKGEVSLKLDGIEPEHIGVELITTQDMKELVEVHSFNLSNVNSGIATYTCDLRSDWPGTFEYGVRIFPKHEQLAHRQDFALLKWI